MKISARAMLLIVGGAAPVPSLAQSPPTLNIPPACAAAVTASGPGGQPLWRTRAQLSKAELACYYELHRATRAGLDRAVAALRTYYDLDRTKAAQALGAAQCALLVGAGDLMLFERGRASLGLITPRAASELGSRTLWLQRAPISPRTILHFTKTGYDTMRLLHGLQAPRPGRLC